MAVRVRLRLALAASCAAAIPALGMAADTEFPARKPGWWELDMTTQMSSGAQPVRQTVHLCTNPAVDKVQTPVGVRVEKRCQPLQVSRTSGGWSFTQTCVMGRRTTTSQGQVRGDFNSRYHVDMTMRMTPAPIPQAAEVRTTMDAKWLGACPAGKKPGDVETSLAH
jgi:hypothetical protein